ncbi:DUF21 domain-containing protein, partial [Candidatus Sumerlaeota bacterium]|nr:DUF21 domain-containing protein [Candidatus Sumerlaeota bacterium]
MKISFPHTGIQAADTPRRAARFAAVFTMVFLGGWISSAWAAENTAGAMEAANARPVPVLLAVFAALLALAGFTAAAETAIFSLNKLDFVRIRNEKSKSARALAYLLDHPTNTLTTILVLSSFVSIGMSLVSGALTESVFKGQS